MMINVLVYRPINYTKRNPMGKKKKKEQLYYPNGEKKPRNIPFLNWLFFFTWAPLFIMPIVQFIVGNHEPTLTILRAINVKVAIIYLIALFGSGFYVGNRLTSEWLNGK